MPNPTINPPWGADLTYTITDSDWLALDVHFSGLDVEPAQVELTVPSGGAVHAVRDPTGWNSAGSEVLGGGGWTPGPVILGNWTLSVTPGPAATDPATIEVTNVDGLAPSGLLRLVVSSLGGSACDVSPGGGSLSIDRLLADPAILNPQVASPSLPIHEKDAVSLTATAQATVQVNPAPSPPLPALPSVIAAWTEEPGNPAAITDFASAGTSATFTAPAAYDTVALEFRLTAAYDLAGNATIDPTDPSSEHVLSLDVETVTHGMVLVLDRSGSMASSLGGGTSKWQATVQAAHAWLDLFRALRTGGDHKAGIVTFEHDSCSWVTSGNDDVTLRDPQTGASASGMQPLAAFGDAPFLSLGTQQTCTPIGDGLVAALEAIGATLGPDDRASVVLLTDGYENSGEVTIKLTPSPAPKTFQSVRAAPPLDYPNDLLGDRLFTIGVGSSVDEDRLNDLPKPSGASSGSGYYRLTTDVKEILPTFLEMLGLVLDAQPALPTTVAEAPPPDHPVYFNVAAGDQRVVFLIPWGSATDNIRIAWRNQDTADPFTLVQSTDAAVIGYWRRQSHGLIAVDLNTLTGSDNPPATQWRVQHLDASDVAQPLTDENVLCVEDLVTKADVRFDKPSYFTGDPIRLSCSIRSGGRRVTGATIGVDVARPGEGLGTFLATNGSAYKKIIGDDRPRGIAAAGGQQVDPDQGKGLMFKTLLRHKEIDALPVITPPAFHLHDDGAHGDGAVDDGDYANSFTDTEKEGTYTFRFRIEGTLDDGTAFSRLFVRSTWVGVRPDPVATTIHWSALSDLPDGQLGQLVTLTPRNAAGEYLGPFRDDVIDLKVWGGTADGPLRDNLDGSYSQRVLYRPGQDPVVSVGVYGTPLPPARPGAELPPDGGDQSCLRLWIRAILCTLRKIIRLIFRR